MNVKPAGKPPKLRFRPGTFVKYKGSLCEVMYCYRVQDAPHEWLFCLEERQSLSSVPADFIGQALNALGAGSTTPRVVYELFRDSMDALKFFSDIPRNGNSTIVTNKTMLNEVEIVSSGEVLG